MGKTKQSIKIPVNQIKKLKTDPAFILIMRLCRHLNQIHFCVNAYKDYSNGNSLKSTLQTHNAIYFLSGVLYEAIKINNRQFGQHFGTYKAYQEGFKGFNKIPGLEEFKKGALNRMRNGVAFHTCDDRIEKTLQTLDLRRYDFVVMSGTAAEYDLYYQLADDIALNHIVGVHDSPADEQKYLRETYKQLLDIGKTFVRNAQNLIDEYIQRKHWKAGLID